MQFSNYFNIIFLIASISILISLLIILITKEMENKDLIMPELIITIFIIFKVFY